jgi:phage terminase large subunit-like protein
MARKPANPVDAYAARVVAGERPAGRYHVASCARHLRDRERERDRNYPYRFDWKQAQRFFEFAGHCHHYRGEWAGQPFVPSESQVFRKGSVFGWRDRETGLRRFTSEYNELCRKQGKSFEEAIEALYVTFGEGEPGNEGYCIAMKREQAKRVWDDCAAIVRNSPALRDRIRIQAGSLHHDASASVLKPLGADVDSSDGLNPGFICCDEFHAFKVRDLLDVVESGMGARRNPMLSIITTAGEDLVSPCGEEHEYAQQILDGLIEDEATERRFCFIAHADPEDDWQLESTWRKANPHLGSSVKLEDMRALALKAIHVPSAAAEFKQKRLGLWTPSQILSLSLDGWQRGQTVWHPSQLAREKCYIGVDLSSKLALTAVSLLFPPTPTRPTFRVIQQIWTPGSTLASRAHLDRAPYEAWVDAKWMQTVDGPLIDPRVIVESLRQLRTVYDVQSIGFDPWHADRIITDLTADGWAPEQLIQVPQGVAHLTGACVRFKEEVVAGRIDARGCPVTAWALGNVVDRVDSNGNVTFSKKNSRGRIDPIVSIVNALSLWLRQPQEVKPQYQIMVFGRGSRW